MGNDLSFHEPADRRFDRYTRSHAPAAFGSFLDLVKAGEGHGDSLTKRQRELIGLAGALITQCPWCLETHSRTAGRIDSMTEGDLAELIVTVAAAKIQLTRLGVRQLAPGNATATMSTALRNFGQQIDEPKALSVAEVNLIRLAVATVVGAGQGDLDSFATAAEQAGVTPLAVRDTVAIAATMNAASVLAHGRMIWKFFEDERKGSAPKICD